MEFDKCLKTRRSIRDYKNKKISLGDLHKVLNAARYAPSSGNLQNWRFIVVEDKKKKEGLAEASLKQNFVARAPVVVVVCDDVEDVKRNYGEQGKLYAIQNCSVTIQNMMLKANDIGIGSCWVGGFDKDKVREILKIPDRIIPEAIITFGYANGESETPHKIDLNDLVYFEEWGNKEKD